MSDPLVTDLADDFRQAMRRVASTVHVVTIRVGGTPMGLTATAVSSLAMAPPSLLVCINQASAIHREMDEVECFCVNALHASQADVARAFGDSAMRDVRFQTGAWVEDGDAPPRLEGATVAVRCRIEDRHAFGTHSIVIGRAERVWLREGAEPLVYLDGRYLETPSPPVGEGIRSSPARL